ncbi:MAG: ECF-type sigma factor [Pirellula sp.]
MSTRSLLDWFGSLRQGQDLAVEKLWKLYFQRMVQVARRKLDGVHNVVRDEEDIALSAFKSFCFGFQQGRFDADANRENLWPLLVTLTINKSIDHIRSQNRAKRGGKTKGDEDAVTITPATISPADVLDEIASKTPSPDLQVVFDESFQRLLKTLDETQDAALRQIALLALEGYRPSQIAEQLGNGSIRTIQRKLKTIRSIWEADLHATR